MSTTQKQSRQVKRAVSAAEDKAAKVTAKAAKRVRFNAEAGFAKAGMSTRKAGEKLESLTIRLNAEAEALSKLSVATGTVLAEAHHLTKAEAKRLHKGASVISVSTSVTASGSNAIKLGDTSSGLAWEWHALAMRGWSPLTFYCNIAAMGVGYYLTGVDSLRVYNLGVRDLRYRVADTAKVMAAFGVLAAPGEHENHANVFTPLKGKALAEAKRLPGFFDLPAYAKANAEAFNKVNNALQALLEPTRKAMAAVTLRHAEAKAKREAKAEEGTPKAEAESTSVDTTSDGAGWYGIQYLEEMYPKAVYTTPAWAEYLGTLGVSIHKG